MPRNDQITRQWHLLRLLESPRGITLAELQSRLPTDYARHARTVRRDLEAFVRDALTVMRGPRIKVELLFDKATAAWAKDRVRHSSQQLKQLPGGKLRMTLTVADSRELVDWILSFGSGVRVVQPKSLRAAVGQEARRILASQ